MGYMIFDNIWKKELTPENTESWSDNGKLKTGVYVPTGFNVRGKRAKIKVNGDGSVEGHFFGMHSDERKDSRKSFGFTGKVENQKLMLTERVVRVINGRAIESNGGTVTFDLSDPKKLSCMDCNRPDLYIPNTWVMSSPSLE